MAKTKKKPGPKPGGKKKRKAAEPAAIDYRSPEVIREWDDAYFRLAGELAERHRLTNNHYLEMKDALPKLKKRVEALGEEMREAENRWRKYRGHKPPSEQGTLDDLRAQAAEHVEPAAERKALPPAAEPGWFPDDLWKRVPIERWEKYGLTPEIVEKMKAGKGKGNKTVPPIHTVGDISGFIQPYENDPTFTNSFSHIKGIGAETATKIDEAHDRFWKDWNDGFAAAFALEQGFTPGEKNADDKSTSAGAGSPDSGPGDERPKRKGGRHRKSEAEPEPAAAEPRGPLGDNGGEAEE